MTVQEAAEALRVAPSTVYKCCTLGTLEHVRVLGAIRVRRSAVEAILADAGEAQAV
jgi:excisionase family DNA binding protein